jgi:hypothetical protein
MFDLNCKIKNKEMPIRDVDLNITCMFTLNNIESYLELIQGNVKDEV